MTKEMQEFLQSEEIVRLKQQYHDIFGEWAGYNYDEFSDFEDYKKYLKESIRTGEKQPIKRPRWTPPDK